MRLVTRCPACATTFKVVRDQLRISDGWVRCGRCSEVFDATLDLTETDDDGAPVAPPPSASSAGRPQAKENLLPLSTGMGLSPMSWPAADLLELGPKPAPLPTTPPVEEDPVPIPSLNGGDDEMHEPWFEDLQFDPQGMPPLHSAIQSALSTSESTPHPARESRKEPGFTPALTTPSPIEEAVNAQLQKALRRERVKALRRERAEQKERERVAAQAPATDKADESPAAAEALPDAPLLEAPSAPIGFADAPVAEPAAPTGRLRRVLLALGCLLAAAVLLLQVTLHERDALLAREPRLRPALQTLCQWAGCELAALRQIGAITIEGASFSREKEGEGYRLFFALRNGERVPLAMPSVELTLLDTQQRALVRRVLSPAQFGAPAVLGAGAESSASLPLHLTGSQAENLAPVAGFNLIAFYP